MAGPVAADDITDKFQRSTAGGTATIDHAPLNALLKAYLVTGADGVARLDYPKLVGQQQAGLKSYIQAASKTDPARLDRAEQMAFWINLYNAVTLDAVLARYPVASINDVDIKLADGSSGGGPWQAKLVQVSGVDLSLDDIENKIVRPLYKDPRAHYALNCLSVGCPNLRPVALTGSNIEAELEAAARAYVNDPRGISFADGKVTGSSIYEWFVDDFGGFDGVVAHMTKYAADPLKAKLAAVKRFDAYAYDWALADSGAKR